MNEEEFKIQLAWLQANLDAEREVRKAAEEERNKALELIREVCQAFIPEELDQVMRENQLDVKRWNPQDYRDFILKKGMARLRRLELLSQGNLGEALERLKAENERLRNEVGTLQEQLVQSRDRYEELLEQYHEVQDCLAARDAELSRLRGEVTHLRQSHQAQALSSGHDPVPEVTTGEGQAEWFTEWQASKDFAQDVALLRVLGFQGFCLRRSVEQALAEAGVVTPGSGTAKRLFARMRAQGLVEEFSPQTETIGRTPFLLRLTTRGREAFRLLFGQEAVESEYDRLLARHKSDEHVLLNLQARDVLLQYGAEAVDLYPQPIPLPSGGTFDVDLVAVFPGQGPLYIEAERGGKKKKEERDRKWANYRLVTDHFYIVVPNKKVQARIITEITTWAYPNQTRLTLHLCNLSSLKEGGPLWQFERAIGPRPEGDEGQGSMKRRRYGT